MNFFLTSILLLSTNTLITLEKSTHVLTYKKKRHRDTDREKDKETDRQTDKKRVLFS